MLMIPYLLEDEGDIPFESRFKLAPRPHQTDMGLRLIKEEPVVSSHHKDSMRESTFPQLDLQSLSGEEGFSTPTPTIQFVHDTRAVASTPFLPSLPSRMVATKSTLGNQVPRLLQLIRPKNLTTARELNR